MKFSELITDNNASFNLMMLLLALAAPTCAVGNCLSTASHRWDISECLKKNPAKECERFKRE